MLQENTGAVQGLAVYRRDSRNKAAGPDQIFSSFLIPSI